MGITRLSRPFLNKYNYNSISMLRLVVLFLAACLVHSVTVERSERSLGMMDDNVEEFVAWASSLSEAEQEALADMIIAEAESAQAEEAKRNVRGLMVDDAARVKRGKWCVSKLCVSWNG